MSSKAADFSLILKLLAGIVIGSLVGMYLGGNTQSPLHHIMDAVVSLRYI
ncbi:MAG TPA: dicarboxylate/amino acid:cation symporter, partial [Candidatus Avidesulfovibrio excrementigallinarum]|nr:dicarboxylate/amino acid:cation symporter [Candidatus Avidesulfovibrio excrementigallinarum]